MVLELKSLFNVRNIQKIFLYPSQLLIYSSYLLVLLIFLYPIMSPFDFFQREQNSGFLPEGRPKKWREKGMQVLENSVIVRIEANQFEDRQTNKIWLIRHLEVGISCHCYTVFMFLTVHVMYS